MKPVAAPQWIGIIKKKANIKIWLHSDLLAPVQTIFPELKIRAVVLGSLILMMTAAKR